MLMTNLLNLLTSQKRREENTRIKTDTHFNQVQAIANEYSADTPEKIQERIFLAETTLATTPFWRKAEQRIFTEALYRAQNLINSRERIFQKQSTIAHAPIVLLKKKAA